MKNVVVIGAGIAGLSAAIYAQRSGFQVTLCEQHNITGGNCTSWKRKGYLFEGAIHWLTGSNPKTEMYQLWEETGALNDSVKVHRHDPFQAVEWEGKTIYLYCDINKTAEQFLAISPRDKKQISRLVSDVKTLSCVQLPISDIKGVKTQNPKRKQVGSILKMVPAIPAIIRLSKMSVKDYAERFEHPAIRQLLYTVPENYSAISLIVSLATLDTGDGGYPEGGSLPMVARMTKTFEDLGGELRLKTRVKKVNIANGTVTGVTLEDETLVADAVIVTQETISAIDQLFDTPLNEAWLEELRKTAKHIVCTFIGVGIRVKIPPVPFRVWNLEKPITYAGVKVSEISFNNYASFDDYAPEGCSTVTTALMGDTYNFWKQAKDEGRYEAEKKSLAQHISQIICQIYPQAEGNIEVIDIATPLTYERYTGAYHGAWMSLVGAGDKMRYYPGDVKCVNGLYFAGHRIMSPGGLPVALVSGRTAAQMVCRQFNVVFKSKDENI